MDEHSAAELRRLQLRAYGRDPDIAEDAAALARLADLESRARDDLRAAASAPVEASTGSDAGDPDPSTPRADPASEPGASDSDGPAEVPPRTTSIAPPRVRGRVLGVAWAVSLVVVGLVVGLSTYAVTWSGSPTARAPGIHRVATLNADPGYRLPRTFADASAQFTAYGDFNGLTAVSARGWPGAGGETCLILIPTDGLGSGSTTIGSVRQGCAAGDFEATVTVEIGPDFPEDIRNTYPDGSALQFVLTGTRVLVYADESSAATPTPTP
jgi:hypothetical protein